MAMLEITEISKDPAKRMLLEGALPWLFLEGADKGQYFFDDEYSDKVFLKLVPHTKDGLNFSITPVTNIERLAQNVSDIRTSLGLAVEILDDAVKRLRMHGDLEAMESVGGALDTVLTSIFFQGLLARTMRIAKGSRSDEKGL